MKLMKSVVLVALTLAAPFTLVAKKKAKKQEQQQAVAKPALKTLEQMSAFNLSSGGMSSLSGSSFQDIIHKATRLKAHTENNSADLYLNNTVVEDIISTSHKVVLCNGTKINNLTVKAINVDPEGKELAKHFKNGQSAANLVKSVVIVDSATVLGVIKFADAPGYVLVKGNSKLSAADVINGKIITQQEADAIAAEKVALINSITAEVK